VTGVEVAVLLVCVIIRAIYRLLTGAAQREREEERRWQEKLLKEEQARQRQEELRRKVIEEAKQQFQEAVMGGRFPSDEVLAILADCDSDIPANPKEAVEELVYGRCSLHSMTFSHAVRIIQQRQRTEERAKARVARGDGDGSDPTGPVTQAEACELLGVSPGCSPEKLASAYHRKVLQWHPDKLETMAQELRDYATRRTARINEAYDRLRSARV
jgi:hypothetical protein